MIMHKFGKHRLGKLTKLIIITIIILLLNQFIYGIYSAKYTPSCMSMLVKHLVVIMISELWLIFTFLVQFQPLLQLGHPLPDDSQLTVTISPSSTSTGGVGVASSSTRGPHLCGECNNLEYILSLWVLVQCNHLK